MPILLLADLEDRARVVRGLDIGVNDYLLTRPIDRNELVARVRSAACAASAIPTALREIHADVASRWR